MSVTLDVKPIRHQQDPGCLQAAYDTVSKTCMYIWEKGCVYTQAITAIFFRCISFVSPALADKLEAIWGNIQAVYLRVTAAMREEALLGEIEGYKEHALEQERRIQKLVHANEALKVQCDQFDSDKGQTIANQNELIRQREDLTREKGQLAQKNHHLEEANRELTEANTDIYRQNNALRQDKETLISDNAKIEQQMRTLLEELGSLRAQTENAEAYRNLNTTLTHFQNMYTDGNPNASQYALKTLVPQWQAHRESFHRRLDAANESFPPNSSIRLTLAGIKQVSQEEMEHLQTLSQALQPLMPTLSTGKERNNLSEKGAAWERV